MKNISSHLWGRAEEARPEEARWRGAENGRVEDTSSCATLVIHWLVWCNHGPRELKAAVVAVVLHQGQGVILFWRRAGEERKRVYFQFLSITKQKRKKGRGNTVKLNGALPLYPPILLPLSCPEGPDLLTPSLKKRKTKNIFNFIH